MLPQSGAVCSMITPRLLPVNCGLGMPILSWHNREAVHLGRHLFIVEPWEVDLKLLLSSLNPMKDHGTVQLLERRCQSGAEISTAFWHIEAFAIRAIGPKLRRITPAM